MDLKNLAVVRLWSYYDLRIDHTFFFAKKRNMSALFTTEYSKPVVK